MAKRRTGSWTGEMRLLCDAVGDAAEGLLVLAGVAPMGGGAEG